MWGSGIPSVLAVPISGREQMANQKRLGRRTRSSGGAGLHLVTDSPGLLLVHGIFDTDADRPSPALGVATGGGAIGGQTGSCEWSLSFIR